MVLVRRKQPNDDGVVETKTTTLSNFEGTPIPKFGDKENSEFKSWNDEACETLDYLDSIGVNIYDKNRYGGMYLKKKTPVNSLANHFATKDDSEKIQREQALKKLFANNNNNNNNNSNGN